MSSLSNPKLIQLLACPDCRNDLHEVNNQLRCIDCNKEYKIKNGIPLLYPSNMDFAHLQEEEKLAKMMKRPRLSPKEQFSAIQWESSKEEFWRMIQKNIKTIPKTIINIGCGYDAHFKEFEQSGYLFVNFDLIYEILYTQQQDFGAKACVAGDITSLPFKKNSFDYVICIDVIHHENNKLLHILKSFWDLIKPGGSLFIEDVNSWGMFQFYKSVLLPKPLYRFLRSIYHRLRRSDHAPADYEFPTSAQKVKKTLNLIGFHNIKIYSNNSYPSIGILRFQVYKFFSRIQRVRKFHNFHYMLSAVKKE
jgi:SAM-dependent methyltransferase